MYNSIFKFKKTYIILYVYYFNKKYYLEKIVKEKLKIKQTIYNHILLIRMILIF